MDLLLGYGPRLKRLPAVIFHGWPGRYQDAQALLKKGIPAYFSFGTTLLRSAKHAIETCSSLPAERILSETDAPWQPPEEKPGQTRARSPPSRLRSRASGKRAWTICSKVWLKISPRLSERGSRIVTMKSHFSDRMRILVGEKGFAALGAAKVAVYGLGGVGAACAMDLVRAGGGRALCRRFRYCRRLQSEPSLFRLRIVGRGGKGRRLRPIRKGNKPGRIDQVDQGFLLRGRGPCNRRRGERYPRRLHRFAQPESQSPGGIMPETLHIHREHGDSRTARTRTSQAGQLLVHGGLPFGEERPRQAAPSRHIRKFPCGLVGRAAGTAHLPCRRRRASGKGRRRRGSILAGFGSSISANPLWSAKDGPGFGTLRSAGRRSFIASWIVRKILAG